MWFRNDRKSREWDSKMQDLTSKTNVYVNNNEARNSVDIGSYQATIVSFS